jgi:hypothetical protein
MTISRGQMKRQLYTSGGITEDDFMKLVAELREAGFSQQEAIEEARKRLSESKAEGGIMNIVPRDKFFLGKVARAVKKTVKKVTKGIGDIISSDAGKLALLGLGGYGLATGSFGLPKLAMPKFLSGEVGKSLAIGAAGALFGGAFAGKSEEEIEAITRDKGALKSYLTQYYTNLNPELRNQPEKVAQFVESQIAEYNQGRGGYAAGGDTASDNAMQAAGIEGLPVRQNPKGVKELDLRETGGFIPPVGIKEKEDDIPAMLSNNEFVFTADAVRGMGDGDVNKGAERMYNMMKTLEAGGRV